MKLSLIAVFIGFLVGVWFAETPAFAREVMEDFSQTSPGLFPRIFKTYPFQRGKAQRVYRVYEENGNRFLHASDGEETGSSVFRYFVWDAKKAPQFSWRWRALKLPQKAESQDCACGLFLVFGGYGGKTIKYIWSTTLPVGRVIQNNPSNYFTVVVDSGPKSVGTWVTHEVNVMEDYKKFFKSDLKKNLSGIGLLTDGDDTHSPSECDYDDFAIGGG